MRAIVDRFGGVRYNRYIVSAVKTVSRWSRLRAPVALVAVAGLFGVAVVAPLTSSSTQASAEELAFQARIHQQFIPNVSAELDLVYTDVTADLSAEEQQRIADEKAAEEKAKADAEAAKAAESAKSESSSGGGNAPLKYSGGGAPAEWMAAAGIAESDWAFVDYIASKESGWNPNATNASSGACGLIQAYPCSKVPGNGYDPVDNLRWASGYATGRYGSWAAAYDFWTNNHWW